MERQRREPKFFKWIGYVLSTLRFKLFLSYILISILPLFILWAIVSVTVDNHILELRLSEQRSMTSQTAITLREINYFDNLVMRSLHDVSLDRDARAFSARIFVADSDGVVVHDSDGAPGTLLTHPTILSALDGEISYSVTEGSDTLIQTAAPITDGYGSIVGAVMLVHTMVDAGGIIAGITDQILLLIAAIAATVALLVFLIASWLLNPLKNVSAAVKKVSEGHLNQRVWLEGRGEIYELGVAFNNMAHRLSQTESARQEFVSNVSHELKTPLSSIKVLSESLILQDDVEPDTYKEFLGDIDSEVDRMTDIINELLTLVRMDETELPLNINHGMCLNILLVDVVKRLRPLADKRAITLEFVAEHQANIDGDEMKLNLAISNVVENAIKYSLDGGHVKVLLTMDSRNAFVTVTDNGVGIDEDDHAKIFTRFYRADKGRDRETGGTGLGLAITHKAIMLHNGSIKLASKLDEGSVFEIRIPRTR